MKLSNTNFKKSLNNSKNSIKYHEELLKTYFPRTFLKYKNIEYLQDIKNEKAISQADSYLKLKTNGVIRDFGVEWKLSGLGKLRRKHKEQGVYSAENISNKETGSMSSSLRNPKGVELLILIEGDEVFDYRIIGVYYWKKFAEWFDQNWQNYKENETKSWNNGKSWHTDNRLIPLSILEIFRVGDY